jgi:hypothetical protein
MPSNQTIGNKILYAGRSGPSAQQRLYLSLCGWREPFVRFVTCEEVSPPALNRTTSTYHVSGCHSEREHQRRGTGCVCHGRKAAVCSVKKTEKKNIERRTRVTGDVRNLMLATVLVGKQLLANFLLSHHVIVATSHRKVTPELLHLCFHSLHDWYILPSLGNQTLSRRLDRHLISFMVSRIGISFTCDAQKQRTTSLVTKQK